MKNIIRILFDLTLAVIAFFFIYPFIYMIWLSLTQSFVLGRIDFDFSKVSLMNYYTIFTNYDFARYFLNSTFVVFCGVVLNLFCSALAGFAFAKLKIPYKNIIFMIYLSTMMIPGSAKLIPTFIIIKELGLINTHIALFLPAVSAFGTFLVKQFVEGVSDEIMESAVLDGASEWQVFIHIMLPLMRPVLVSLTIFTFIGLWNDFVWPLVVTTDAELHTLNLALSTLQSNYVSNYGLIMAGASLIFLPPFILYIILQKTFVEGIAMSGSKES